MSMPLTLFTELNIIFSQAWIFINIANYFIRRKIILCYKYRQWNIQNLQFQCRNYESISFQNNNLTYIIFELDS